MLSECYFLLFFKIISSWNGSFWEIFFYPDSSKGSQSDGYNFAEHSTNSDLGIGWFNPSNVRKFCFKEGLTVMEISWSLACDGRAFLPCLQLLGAPLVMSHPGSRCPVSRPCLAPLSRAHSALPSRPGAQNGSQACGYLLISFIIFYWLASLPFCGKVVSALNQITSSVFWRNGPLSFSSKQSHKWLRTSLWISPLWKKSVKKQHFPMPSTARETWSIQRSSWGLLCWLCRQAGWAQSNHTI